MNQPDTTSPTDGEIWHVQMPSGQVSIMTLEQLDDAFQRDIITANTFVFGQGATAWQRLGELLGLDDEPNAPAMQPATSDEGAHSPTQLLPPAGGAPPGPQPAGQSAPIAPAPMVNSGSSGPMHAQHGNVAQPAPSQFAPIQAAYPVPATPLSTAPLASNIDDMELEFGASPFQRKRRRGVYIVLGIAAAAVIAVAAMVSPSATPEASVAAAQPPPPTTAAAPTPAPSPEPEKAQPPVDSRLKDDTKRALLEADKKREKADSEKQKQLKEKRQAAPSRRGSKKGPAVFHKGGSKYDPLNSSL